MAFTGIARLLMVVNTCTNPFIYATTIPEFKELSKALFTCNVAKTLDDMMSDVKRVANWRKSMAIKPSSISALSFRNIDEAVETLSFRDIDEAVENI